MGKRRSRYLKPNSLFANSLSSNYRRTKLPCIEKQTYYFIKDARNVALLVRMRGEKNVYPYDCEHCGYIHLGHQYN